MAPKFLRDIASDINKSVFSCLMADEVADNIKTNTLIKAIDHVLLRLRSPLKSTNRQCHERTDNIFGFEKVRLVFNNWDPNIRNVTKNFSYALFCTCIKVVC